MDLEPERQGSQCCVGGGAMEDKARMKGKRWWRVGEGGREREKERRREGTGRRVRGPLSFVAP